MVTIWTKRSPEAIGIPMLAHLLLILLQVLLLGTVLHFAVEHLYKKLKKCFIYSCVVGAWAHYSSPTENSPLQAFNRSPTGNGMSPIGMPSLISNAARITPIGKDIHRFSNNNQSIGAVFQHSHSYPDRNPEHMSSSPGTLTGPQFLWGSPKPYSEHSHSPVWRPPAIRPAMSSNSRSQGQGFLYGSRQTSLFGSSDQNHQNHVGSAPSGAPFSSHFGFMPESPETSFLKQVKFGNVGNIGSVRNGGGLMLNMANRGSVNPVSSLNGSLADNKSTDFRQMLSPRLGQLFYSNPIYQGPGSFVFDNSIDRARTRRVDSSALQADNRKQYQLDLEKIQKGDDTRTTLMIKNIPNKYALSIPYFHLASSLASCVTKFFP
jgi:hypothetical protein